MSGPIRLRRHGKPLSPGERRAVKIIVILVLVIIALAVAAMTYPRYRTRAMKERMARAAKMLESGNAEGAEGAIQVYLSVEADFTETEAAQEAARERERLEPYVAEAAELKEEADALFKKGDCEQAVQIYRDIMARFPVSRMAIAAKATEPICAKYACDVLNDKVVAALDAERWDEVKDGYERILAIDPDYEGAREGLESNTSKLGNVGKLLDEGKSFEERDLWSEALDAYDRALAIMPPHTVAYTSRTRVLLKVTPPEGMVLVPPGEFVVGSEEGELNESPRRTLTTHGFYIDATEVTNAQYAKFVQETDRSPPSHWDGAPPNRAIAALPVVCVSYYDAAAYAEWAGKRLPTEEEWERAARGRRGRKYPWGDDFKGDEAILASDSEPVGQIASDRSEDGCFDMGGNVSEWTSSELTVARVGRGGRRRRRRVPLPLKSTGYNAIRGASWAGIENGRTDRVVSYKWAEINGDPTRAVLVDNRKPWGIEARKLRQTAFFLRGVSRQLAMVEITEWLAGRTEYVSSRFPILPGKEIAGTRNVTVGTGEDAQQVSVTFDTGCRLVNVTEAEDPAEAFMTYVDARGLQRAMWISKPAAPRVKTEKRRRRRYYRAGPDYDAYKAFIKSSSSRSLADLARSANRMGAPPDARFINCGFRCVKDP